MLSNEQAYVLGLLRNSLGVAPASTPADELDHTVVTGIVRRSGVLLTVYTSLEPDSPVWQSLRSAYYAALSQSVNQEREGRTILEAFDVAGMRCIGLKGWELQRLYPNPVMRQMADLDILVNPYEYRAIRAVLTELGYEAESAESPWMHDGFSKDIIHVEVHKRLSDDLAKIRDWERRMWGRAVRGDVAWSMTAPDYYVFHFVHLHKDFLAGTLGLRRLADTWILDHSMSEGDLRDAKAELEAIGLAKFSERMSWLARVCMGEDYMDEDAELLLSHAFQNGIYGTSRTYKAGRIASMSRGGLAGGKVRSALAAVFLPYRRMKAEYPVLERWPVLLPVCWVRRILHYLQGDLGRYRRMLDYREITSEDIEEIRRFFIAGGCGPEMGLSE